MAPADVVASGDADPQQQYADVLSSLDAAGLPGTCVTGPEGGLAIRVPIDDAQVLSITEVAGPLAPCRADLRGWGVSVLERVPGDEPKLVAWDGADRTDVCGLLALISGVLLDTMRGPSTAA